MCGRQATIVKFWRRSFATCHAHKWTRAPNGLEFGHPSRVRYVSYHRNPETTMSRPPDSSRQPALPATPWPHHTHKPSDVLKDLPGRVARGARVSQRAVWRENTHPQSDKDISRFKPRHLLAEAVQTSLVKRFRRSIARGRRRALRIRSKHIMVRTQMNTEQFKSLFSNNNNNNSHSLSYYSQFAPAPTPTHQRTRSPSPSRIQRRQKLAELR